MERGENLRIKIAKVETMIGTWNVKKSRQCGKMEVLAQEMDRMVWHVLGITEMRWKGIGEGTTEDGHKFWHSGNERKCVHGVGFLVNKKCSKSVMGFTPVSERIAAIRIA